MGQRDERLRTAARALKALDGKRHIRLLDTLDAMTARTTGLTEHAGERSGPSSSNAHFMDRRLLRPGRGAHHRVTGHITAQGGGRLCRHGGKHQGHERRAQTFEPVFCAEGLSLPAWLRVVVLAARLRSRRTKTTPAAVPKNTVSGIARTAE